MNFLGHCPIIANYSCGSQKGHIALEVSLKVNPNFFQPPLTWTFCGYLVLALAINPITIGKWTYKNEIQNILVRGMDVLWIWLPERSLMSIEIGLNLMFLLMSGDWRKYWKRRSVKIAYFPHVLTPDHASCRGLIIVVIRK